MNQNFPRILSLLRKEKGISQKKAAEQLGVSQALLSHYEKGIRECGLEFVVRAADFYHVSCDYLLGRSPDRDGTVLSIEELPEPDAAGKENVYKGSLLPTLNKKLVENSLNILYDLLQRAGSNELTTEISQYLSLAVYTVFRKLYETNGGNPDELFRVSRTQYPALTMAAMLMARMRMDETLAAKPLAGGRLMRDKLKLPPQLLAERYPLFATSLTNLLKNTETLLEKQLR